MPNVAERQIDEEIEEIKRYEVCYGHSSSDSFCGIHVLIIVR